MLTSFCVGYFGRIKIMTFKWVVIFRPMPFLSVMHCEKIYKNIIIENRMSTEVQSTVIMSTLFLAKNPSPN